MSPVDARDEEWLRDRIAEAVPTPPSAPDRLAKVRAGRQKARRRRTTGLVAAACLVVGGVALTVPAVLGQGGQRGSSTPADERPTTAPTTTGPPVVTPELVCPSVRTGESDGGPSSLAEGATAARLCGGGMRGGPATAPRDLLTTGLDALVESVNTQQKGFEGCFGPIGDRYILMLAYPDGTARRVLLDFSGCGVMLVGGVNRLNPREPYQTFMDLLRDQRATATPPAEVPAPECMQQYSEFSPIADPAQMVLARLCVTYDEGVTTTSAKVSSADLAGILDAWRTGPRTPMEKGPACDPTSPTWVLSGMTEWGDPVQITAECGRASDDDEWVALTPGAQDVVDQLVASAR